MYNSYNKLIVNSLSLNVNTPFEETWTKHANDVSWLANQRNSSFQDSRVVIEECVATRKKKERDQKNKLLSGDSSKPSK